MRASALRRESMSATVPEMRSARPSASRSVTRPRACSHFQRPSRVGVRNSASNSGASPLSAATQAARVRSRSSAWIISKSFAPSVIGGERSWPRNLTQPSPA